MGFMFVGKLIVPFTWRFASDLLASGGLLEMELTSPPVCLTHKIKTREVRLYINRMQSEMSLWLCVLSHIRPMYGAVHCSVILSRAAIPKHEINLSRLLSF